MNSQIESIMSIEFADAKKTKLSVKDALYALYCNPHFFVDNDNYCARRDRIVAYIRMCNMVFGTPWGIFDYEELADEIAKELVKDNFSSHE